MSTLALTLPDSSREPRSCANVLGVRVDAINMEDAVALISHAIEQNLKGYVCVTGVHGIIEAQTDPDFKRVINDALLVTPDGMPTVWVGRAQRHSAMARVYGPDLMLEMCRVSLRRGYRHFLYGGHEGVAQQLAANLTARYPGLKIVGTYTPPFRPLNETEEQELQALVAATKPDIIWVGLGAPKQEKFMHSYFNKLDAKVMLGVGAAFDIHTGRLKDSPAWIKRAGLQWLHRLYQEPRRLARRYLISNPRFVYNIGLQLLRLRHYEL